MGWFCQDEKENDKEMLNQGSEAGKVGWARAWRTVQILVRNVLLVLKLA